MSTSTYVSLSPKSPESEKNRKYDRQLRLWGDHGQTSLESAHICLINATATGTEILKSIVLPGIGAFTVVDGNKISAEDAGNNFFLNQINIGKPRAQIACELLLELNSDVRGDFVDETPEHLLDVNPSFFDNYSVVIATGLVEKTLEILSGRLWNMGVPFLVCRTYGMIGYMRIQIKEHCVLETHPENEIADLRLDKPFPQLKEFVDSLNMDKMTFKEHSHTPFVVVLLKYLTDWKAINGNNMPKSYPERKAFKEMIRKGIVMKNYVYEEEENFEEALRAANTVLNPLEIPAHVQSIFEDPFCLQLSNESKPFWILARAVKEFTENEGEGALPVRGSIPDMTADSTRYVQLQNIYRSKANDDSNAVMNRVQQLLSNLGKPQDLISESDVKLFCKNASWLKVVRGRPFAEEYNPKLAKTQEIAVNLDNPDSEIIFYVMLRAVDRFYTTYNRYPGYFNNQVEPDIIKLKNSLGLILQEWGIGPLAKDDYIHEMCRYGASELHSVASFIGGCAAQEVIKLITGQYVPFNNTFIYNAITATSAVFEL